MKRGISLIALVITIIVIIILASIVIISFNEDGIVNKAEEATFKSDFSTILESFTMNKNNRMLQNLGNANISNTNNLEGLKQYIPIIDEQQIDKKSFDGQNYTDLIEIYNEKIYQKRGLDNDEIKRMLDEVGIPEFPDDGTPEPPMTFEQRIEEEIPGKQFLYKYGEKYTDLTSGWLVGRNVYGVRNVIENERDVYFEVRNTENNGNFGAHAQYTTNNLIDVTNYTKLVVAFKDINVSETSDDDKTVSFSLRESNIWNNTVEPIKQICNGNNFGNQILELDISEVTGQYYVAAAVNSNKGVIKTTTATLVAIWLEP